jgi:hypothetical protein
MQTTPIAVAVNRDRKRPMPCFISGCGQRAEHLTRFNYGDVVVQVCLCEKCLKMTPDCILSGLRPVPDRILQG